MQQPDASKRTSILDAATLLFSKHAYHEVLLEDIAAAAKVGKGTVYMYFTSKENLYLTLVREGFVEMVGLARASAEDRSKGAWTRLAAVIAGLVQFGTRYPNLYRVMRGGLLTADDRHLQQTRADLTGLVESILRDGIQQGELRDPYPELTAQFVLSFVRGALLYPPPNLTLPMLEQHVLMILRHGIGTGSAA